jgi:hypothetical protein
LDERYGKLQQLWRKPRFGQQGHLVGWDTEWRDVEVVYT